MGFFDKLKREKKEQPEGQAPLNENLEPETKEEPGGEPIIKQEENTATGMPDDLQGGPGEEEEETAGEKRKKGFFSRLKSGLGRTRDSFTGKIDQLLGSGRKLDDEFFEELEEILIQADVGVNTTLDLVEELRKAARSNRLKDTAGVRELLKEMLTDIMSGSYSPLAVADTPPTVILMVGVNGVGKTTTIAKLARWLKEEGNKVILAAGDTFRAAAIDQLQVWADRVGVEVIRQTEGADPAAVVFDALAAARARKADYLIVDTAGRLHNKTNLMQEIAKVRKVIEREIPGAPHECLLVLDATTGQNAISQAQQFKEATGVTGIVLTKLDGTAKGGITVAVAHDLDIPVKLIGIGEGMDDLREFEPREFIEALFAVS